MFTLVKYLTAFILLYLAMLPLQAADTLKIHLTYFHEIPDGKNSTGYFTIDQKFYTPGDTLFREIIYDKKTKQISSYIFYFYRNDRLFSEECYNSKDSIIYIKKHDFDAAGNEITLSKYEILKDRTVLVEKASNTYDSGNRLLQKTIKAGKKNVQQIRYSYNETNNLSKEIRKNNPSLNKGIKSEILDYIYNTEGKLIQMNHSLQFAGNKTTVSNENYIYNKNGLLEETKISNENDDLILIKSYEYLNSGYPKYYQEKNKEGLITLLLEYDYKKHLMNYGTQKSFFNK